MTYQQLDFIADLYIPFLALSTLCRLTWQLKIAGSRQTMADLATTVFGVIYIYALMFLDQYAGAYGYFGLDYSTHTALALVFVTCLAFINKKAALVSSASMVMYGLLMMYQNYHTLLDILVTTVMVLPILIWLKYRSSTKTLSNTLQRT
ncbi:hypothetical protein [Vibrio sagamiensis]|uniref:Phosphatidic acid phosphatase type 2/haloperoxidase domain-containing protein n=1 Tax=Vibrio sagamiensis NBRC 104589 TaxID=1219064 RepID=A0A511QB14_9VIBR|nr:hypothetical protein [Vibrio sagamiensis]PNQ62417.1 hypothetical protein C1141_10665 [Vibrio agarivorans]GEM74499.1 hypothetical protein VSA01S_06110 [Vibrio sagamiensis NBRC 104589]